MLLWYRDGDRGRLLVFYLFLSEVCFQMRTM